MLCSEKLHAMKEVTEVIDAELLTADPVRLQELRTAQGNAQRFNEYLEWAYERLHVQDVQAGTWRIISRFPLEYTRLSIAYEQS